jgi:CheY-like chemotaxis protein
MTVYLSSGDASPAHAVEIAGGSQPVLDALAASLTHAFGYRPGDAGDRPVIHLIADAMDHSPDEVSTAYVLRSLAPGCRPIPLFLTARPKRFTRRGLAWEEEFLFASGDLRLDSLAARMRMLAHMWGNDFPVDLIRDAVVGSFRMNMRLDEADYHQRSDLIEDLQRVAGWDGTGEPPVVRAAPNGVWHVPYTPEHPYSRLFANAYEQIVSHMNAMLSMKNLKGGVLLNQAPDLASAILRKVPSSTGRFVHSLRDTRPRVLIIDDEAVEIAASLGQHRVGYENDSATLADIFEFVPETLSLDGQQPLPPYLPEDWVRDRVAGRIRPGGQLADLRCADLILLDLSLNQSHDSELAGFILLEKLRNAIPDLPLVIHTGSAALGHIIQAIRNGADWYVRKDGARTYSDLASILSDIGRRPEWTKRARRLERERLIGNERELPPALQNEKYLYIWRSLATDLPDGELQVLPFSDGASGAVTCGVQVYGSSGDEQASPDRPVASFVAKIDEPYVMLSERERFRRLVRPRIGNRAGRIDSDVVYAGPSVAGIAYTFSGIHQGQKGASRTSLQPLSTFLGRALGESPFVEVAPVFDELLNDLLQTLHRSSPSGPRSSWAEPLFDEGLSLRDTHEMRLPPRVDLELSAFADPDPDSRGAILTDVPGETMHLPMCRVQRASERGVTVVFRDAATGFAHRANLTGEIAQFLARFRHLRPNRALSATGRVVRNRSARYDTMRADVAADAAWLQENGYPDSTLEVDRVLQKFEDIGPETLGIIHGDLNLNNILLDVDANGAPIRGALWLIDFARTRRDSLAHDFAELEVDLVTRILAPASGVTAPGAIMDFQCSLDAGPLYARQHFDPPAVFVGEACQFIRRAASAARIEKAEYLASLVMYYLLVLKLQQEPADSTHRNPESFQMRRWSFIGASAALTALQTELGEPREFSAPPRLSILKPKSGPGAQTKKSRAAVKPTWPGNAT